MKKNDIKDFFTSGKDLITDDYDTTEQNLVPNRWIVNIRWISGFRKGQCESFESKKPFEKGQVFTSVVTNDKYQILNIKENPAWVNFSKQKPK